ncbi:MAG: sialate O-acetylesterase [Armatimonadetes bacterium]|nr:sialate O-acetylesterase [Armatimonadota bacterium]
MTSAWIALAALSLGQPDLEPTLKLPAVFSDGMVLQRDMPVPIWGWSHPGEKVTVTFRGQSISTTADVSGKWKVTLDSLTAGGPDELGVFDEDQDIIVRDILVGDVWICSGQSNMAFPLSQAKNSTTLMQEADQPRIRLFKVGFAASDRPLLDVKGRWRVSTPQSAASFSAVGYLFGKALSESEKVPIGLIETCWGGSSAEAWTPFGALSLDPELKPILIRYDRAKVENRAKLEKYRQESKKYRPKIHPDRANLGFARGWASPIFDDSVWNTMMVPGYWEDQVKSLDIDGAVWFRTEVEVPPGAAGSDVILKLGQIADYDTVYWNGQMVGMTGTSEDEPFETPRAYKISGRLVLSGKNTLAVRVFNRKDKGGFGSEPEDMGVVGLDGAVIPIAGRWRYHVETSLSPDAIKPLELPFGPGHPQAPANLFNGMVAPIVPLAVKGVAWYQGESNAERAKQYRTLLTRLISSWRTSFHQSDLPFLLVQLPNFRERLDFPSEAEWAEIREAQLMALKLPKVGMAVTIDLGEANDIHPRNKLPVAERLADAAMQVVYYTTARGQSPFFDTYKIEGSKIRVLFRNTVGSLTTVDGEPPKGFAIAGADGKFIWAQAKIDGESVVIWHEKVPQPKYVRYAWADNPLCNLVNRVGLPASPFRTDTLPGITDNNY